MLSVCLSRASISGTLGDIEIQTIYSDLRSLGFLKSFLHLLNKYLVVYIAKNANKNEYFSTIKRIKINRVLPGDLELGNLTSTWKNMSWTVFFNLLQESHFFHKITNFKSLACMGVKWIGRYCGPHRPSVIRRSSCTCKFNYYCSARS